ncbi:heme exporter protein CcmD [Rheinheimera sp. UJ51]|uniref:heme exporter protein CcmD n=1 Tax=Rheinheimera sp. UJ51 TaxID=2892446 RepID=UPI001E51BE8D|nr:heme exporter protein CcmD [Rheinheimera sp. UJ51]MCC5450317.1 heme exporter protein CcmD [Rheinheimera sp. UJ51]
MLLSSLLNTFWQLSSELPVQLFGVFPFYFASFSDFLAMASNGISYSFFVWLSFGLTYLLLMGLLWWSYYQQRQFKQQLAAKMAREQRIKQYQEQQS